MKSKAYLDRNQFYILPAITKNIPDKTKLLPYITHRQELS